MSTQTHHNNKQVVTVEFTCATGKSSTRSTHYRTQGCEVSPYEDAINGPSSPTFLCTSCLPFLFHPFQRAGPVTQEAYKTVNLTNGNRIPVPHASGEIQLNTRYDTKLAPRSLLRTITTYAIAIIVSSTKDYFLLSSYSVLNRSLLGLESVLAYRYKTFHKNRLSNAFQCSPMLSNAL